MAHDEYLASLIAAHRREKIVYTWELAHQIAVDKGYKVWEKKEEKKRGTNMYIPE